MELVIRGLVPLSYNSRSPKNKEAYFKKIRSAFLRKFRNRGTGTDAARREEG